MKKTFAVFTLALCASLSVLAQDTKMETEKKNIVKPSRDFVMFQITYENWNNVPDYVKVGGLGRGFNAYLAYDFPIAKSNFSFAAGVGISTSNIYFKDQIAVLNSTSDSIRFIDVDTTTLPGGKKENFYKRSKLNTTYLEAPFELRYFSNKENRNRGFKAAVGMKVGILVGAHSKVRHSLTGPVITEKVNTRRYIQTWRFAPNVRIGWGNFSIYGSYNLSPLFNPGEGPDVYPYSIGICITGL